MLHIAGGIILAVFILAALPIIIKVIWILIKTAFGILFILLCVGVVLLLFWNFHILIPISGVILIGGILYTFYRIRQNTLEEKAKIREARTAERSSAQSSY